jgi:hypothetical protein
MTLEAHKAAMAHSLTDDEPSEAKDAADRASAPVTAESAQLEFWDLFLAIAIGLLTACGFAAVYFR